MSQEKAGRRTRGHHYNKNKINVGDTGKKVVESIDENNLVIQQFRIYSAELDKKYDRFERIVKHNRDITIESKRIIFLLHTLVKEDKQETILRDASLRFDAMQRTLFKNIAHELADQDIYQYLKAYKAGLEEYIEAVTFYQYLQTGCIQDWLQLEKSLVFTNSKSTPLIVPSSEVVTRMLITPHEYMMGIADLTGELMRKCINNLATGDIASCYQTCNFVRNVYKGFITCINSSNNSKDMGRKFYTLKQSLMKIENVCYTIKVRGSEIPKHMLADVAIVATEKYIADEDEGY